MRALFFSGIIYLVSSCDTGTLSEHRPEFTNLTTDSLLFQNLSAKTKVLNLPSISNGVDSFELRVWHGISIATPKWLVILKYQDSAWHLTDTDCWFNYQWTNGRPDKVLLDSSFTNSLKVPSNISSLVDSIRRFRFDTFPSQGEIPDFEDRVADGVFYQIELATPNFYKAIGYSNPARYHDDYNQKVRRLITIMNDIGVFSMP